MKITITTLAFCAFCLAQFSASAQEYDLNNYKYRYQQIRSFTGGFNLDGDGDYRFSNYKDNDTFPDYSDFNDGTGRNIRYNFNGFYNINKNTEAMQMGRNVQFRSASSFYGGSSASKLEDSIVYSSQVTGRNFSNNLSISQFNRIYKPNNSFTYFAYNAGGSMKNENGFGRDNQNEAYSKKNDYSVNGGVSIGKGVGRLEYITDAATALFIIKDLQKKAGLGNLTNEQTEIIAKGITTTLNTRFRDFRFRTIGQITMLDSFFELTGAKPTNDVAYFTTLYDNWIYATKFQRFTGKRFTAYVSNDAQYSVTEREESLPSQRYLYRKEHSTRNTTSLNLEYETSKQLNLYRQIAFSIRGAATLVHSTIRTIHKDSTVFGPFNESDNKVKPDHMYYNISANFSHLWQPNTRNFIETSIYGNAIQFNFLQGLRKSNPNNYKQSYIDANAGVSLNYFYFLSPRISFNASGNINLGYNNNVNSEDIIFTPTNVFNRKATSNGYSISSQIRAGFNYAIF